MNLTLLRAFHQVAQAGSFTGAARAGAASQPTLSSQVRALEAGSGAALFNRSGHTISLTPLGHSLLALTTRLFAAEEEAQALLAGTLTLTRGQLRIAADSPTHVMPPLSELKRWYEGVTFTLRIGNSAEVIHRVLDFEADVGVTAKQTSDPRLYCRKLRSDRLVLFVPVHHPWARRRSVAIAEVANRDLVIRERGSITREVFEDRLAEHGVRPRHLVEVQTREAVREAVIAGFGIGIVFSTELGQDFQTRPIAVRDADLLVTEYVICLEERRGLPLVRGFLQAVEATASASTAA